MTKETLAMLRTEHEAAYNLLMQLRSRYRKYGTQEVKYQYRGCLQMLRTLNIITANQERVLYTYLTV